MLNKNIHGLRGFAVIAVFVFHLYDMAQKWKFWPQSLVGTEFYFRVGSHGVEIFFIISGYLITASLIRHQHVGRFLLDRALRIYPVFLAIHFTVFVFGPIIKYKWMAGISFPDWSISFIQNILFLPGVFDLPLAQLNAWSLSYEALFYLLSAGVFVLSKKIGKGAAAILSAPLIIYLILLYPKASYFLVGIAAYFIGTEVIRRAPSFFRLLAIPGFVVTLFLLTLAVANPTLYYWGLAPSFIFFVAITSGLGFLATILRTRVLQYFGTISYSFYLFAPLVTYPMKVIIDKKLNGVISPEIIFVGFSVLGFIASVIVSHYSFIYIEKKFTEHIRNRFKLRHKAEYSIPRV